MANSTYVHLRLMYPHAKQIGHQLIRINGNSRQFYSKRIEGCVILSKELSTFDHCDNNNSILLKYYDIITLKKRII